LTLEPASSPISCAATWLRSASFLHFGGDHGKALAVLAGAGGFDGGVQASRLVW
jgi:hypothetical protein